MLQTLPKIVVTQHSPRSLVFAELFELLFAHRADEQAPPIARDLQQGRSLGQTIVLPLQVSSRAALAIIARRNGQARPHSLHHWPINSP
ncbi:MAG: hypothetical protein GX594_05805 [Pirellulaceae bacterium]|nr:hypothetical protein [Pirellulaceae bacterium]